VNNVPQKARSQVLATLGRCVVADEPPVRAARQHMLGTTRVAADCRRSQTRFKPATRTSRCRLSRCWSTHGAAPESAWWNMQNPQKADLEPVIEETALEPVKTVEAEVELTPIRKPSATSALNKFKSKRAPGLPGTNSRPDVLDIRRIGELKDYVRVSPLEHHWSEEFCFTAVPIDGQKDSIMHLITEELAEKYLPPKLVLRFQLALASGATKGSFFLCVVPSKNLNNGYNQSARDCCIEGKHRWVMASALKEKNQERYHVNYAEDEDFAPTPDWESMPTVDELLLTKFAGLLSIDTPDHPALLRRRGKRQVAS